MMPALSARSPARASCRWPVPPSVKSSANRRARSTRANAAIDPDNANVLVCGGGGIAMLVSKKLKDMGSWVWCMQRSDTRQSQIEGMMALFAKADALDADAVEKVFEGIEDLDAVVSTIGGTPKEPLADSAGNINIIEAAKKRGVKKFVLVTSIGAGDSKDAPPATGTAKLTEDTSVCGAIHREDVADLVIKVLLKDDCNGRTLSAVDPAQMFGEPQFETVEV